MSVRCAATFAGATGEGVNGLTKALLVLRKLSLNYVKLR
jgi:hypothetical protein